MPKQFPRNFIRPVQHQVVTTRQGQGLPPPSFRFFVELRKRRGCPTIRKDISNTVDPTDSSSKPEGLLKARQGVHCGLSIYPVPISCVDVKYFGRNWGCFPAFSSLSRSFELLVPGFRWKSVMKTLAVVRDKGIEINQRPYLFRDTIRNTSDHAARVGVTAQYHVGEFLPTDKIDNVVNVRLEVNLPRQQMAAFADTTQSRCKDFMSTRLQCTANTLPNPTAPPRAMDQNKC